MAYNYPFSGGYFNANYTPPMNPSAPAQPMFGGMQYPAAGAQRSKRCWSASSSSYPGGQPPGVFLFLAGVGEKYVC